MEAMTLNGKEYQVLKLLGKGKGGYSWLVTDGANQYVLKQIHHEPCDYYTFGDKLASELRDYEKLNALGIPMPKLLEVDAGQERLLKEYIDGDTVNVLIKDGRMEEDFLRQMRAICHKLYPAGLNIDYYPTNFIPGTGFCTISIMNATPIPTSGILKIGEANTGRKQRNLRMLSGNHDHWLQKPPAE